MKILFSGLNGLTGSYLAYLLLKDKSELSVASIVRSDNALNSTLSSSFIPSEFFVGDISDINFERPKLKFTDLEMKEVADLIKAAI